MADGETTRGTGMPGTQNQGTMQQQASDVAERIKGKASEWSGRANDTFSEQRDTAAEALSNTASKLHQSASNLPGGERVTSIAHRTADTLEQTSHYLREHDASAMVEDVVSVVRKYPTQAIAGAALAGFLIGRLVRRG